ncbi:hypothetical protein M378DRAFT_157252 [Amanita muscaria Koide BX008]|uniref:Uncharacterized protein n=1 Tax=Amanita muscaria (strain Koide BX008) TaxID=946122 RepID=A0A0C2T2G0_AMAMK|nr:hypothetical protein M378DRAFT_157252 [Amanita muscaria Koide BX008]
MMDKLCPDRTLQSSYIKQVIYLILSSGTNTEHTAVLWSSAVLDISSEVVPWRTGV